jgi:hypothetical protein
MKGVHNFHRFYASFNRLPGHDREDMKETLVSSFTDGRTTSLKEMTYKEYDEMCTSLEERTGYCMELRWKRSQCLKLMQKSGIDTTDWARINAFCQDPRIAGKVFAMLGLKDLEALQVKLRAIIHKGGLKPSRQTSRQALADESQMAVIVLPSTGTIN